MSVHELGTARPSTDVGVTVTAPAERDWCDWYVPAAVGVDLLAGCTAALVALTVRFGTEFSSVYGVASVVFPLLWVLALAANRVYEPRFLGTGAEEYRRVLNGGMHLAAIIAIVAYATKTDVARGYVALAVPLAVLLDLVGRHLLRTRLHALRAQGKAMPHPPPTRDRGLLAASGHQRPRRGLQPQDQADQACRLRLPQPE